MIRVGVGVGSFIAGGYTPTDADALAFVNAAGISDDTQKLAINTLVTDLKGFGIWSKMRAIYPFVGGTASSHRWNLRDPRDLDAAFRLVFSGGITHSSTGALFNGTNGYSNTFLTPSANLTNNSTHLSFYSRTNFNGSPGGDIGTSGPSPTFLPIALIYTRAADLFQSSMYDYDSAKRVSTSNTNSTGFYVGNRTSNVVLNSWKNGVKQATNTTAETQNITTVTNPFFVGAINLGGSAGQYSNKECAFASIGDGLTDTESANFYTAVQKYQTTLGRQVGVPISPDSDSQAFINAAGITDTIQQNAIIALVSDLKFNGIWSKMRAIYPFVGGTASSHRFNLKDPRDLDAAFRLVFNGGATHSSTGYLPNGTNGFADTFLTPNTSLNSSNASFSYYSRTLTTTNSGVEIGVWNTGYSNGIEFALHRSVSTPRSYSLIYTPGTTVNAGSQNSNGHFIANRTSNSLINMFRNGVSIGQNTSTVTLTRPSFKLYLGASNDFGTANAYSNKECAFASIGDGLTDTEAANLYTAVQSYQTSLNRQV